MKTTILFALFVGLMSLNIANAQTTTNPDPKKQVKEYVTKQILYPENAVNLGIEGIVYASFIVNDNGSIRVVQIESTNEKLKEYVSGKLVTMVVDAKEEARNQEIVMKFNFQLL